jgi:hypothetical protein
MNCWSYRQLRKTFLSYLFFPRRELPVVNPRSGRVPVSMLHTAMQDNLKGEDQKMTSNRIQRALWSAAGWVLMLGLAVPGRSSSGSHCGIGS